MKKCLDFGWKLVEKICEFFLKITLKLVGKEVTPDIFEAFMQFVKFGIVGVSNTLISYVIYLVSLLFLNRVHFLEKNNYLIAQTIAFILSVLWSFYWNNKMVFVLKAGKKRSIWKALLKTYVSYSFTGLFLSNLLLILWIEVLGISELIAPIINLIVSVPLNFIINKFWAFKQQ